MAQAPATRMAANNPRSEHEPMAPIDRLLLITQHVTGFNFKATTTRSQATDVVTARYALIYISVYNLGLSQNKVASTIGARQQTVGTALNKARLCLTTRSDIGRLYYADLSKTVQEIWQLYLRTVPGTRHR